MKELRFDINPQIIKYNSSIRTKSNIIAIIIEVSRFLIVSKPQPQENILSSIEPGKIRLGIYIDKMSRIFISENAKIHSFSFPFQLKEEGERYIISFENNIITNVMLSVLSRVFQDISDTGSVEEIVEEFWGADEEFQLSSDEKDVIEKLITYLLCFEPGYLRLDDETVQKSEDAKNKRKKDKITHPDIHIDMNYSGATTFKLGLVNLITCEQLIDLVNINEPCMFLFGPPKVR